MDIEIWVFQFLGIQFLVLGVQSSELGKIQELVRQDTAQRSFYSHRVQLYAIVSTCLQLHSASGSLASLHLQHPYDLRRTFCTLRSIRGFYQFCITVLQHFHQQQIVVCITFVVWVSTITHRGAQHYVHLLATVASYMHCATLLAFMWFLPDRNVHWYLLLVQAAQFLQDVVVAVGRDLSCRCRQLGPKIGICLQRGYCGTLYVDIQVDTS